MGMLVGAGIKEVIAKEHYNSEKSYHIARQGEVDILILKGS